MSMKNILYTIFALFTMLFSAAAGFAAPFFTGYAGALASLKPVKDSSKPNLTAQAFFAGQIDLSGVFLLRTELSVQTDNISANGIFHDTPASFRIDEISATARFTSSGMSHFVGLFVGEYESIGSDLFLQRQFGITPIGSRIAETWRGLSGTSIYPFSDIGLSYVMRMHSPKAAGIYVYTNDKEDLMNINMDVRFGAVYRYATFDVAAGMSFPIENKTDAGEKVFLLIRTMDLHTGFSLLLGNTRTTSLFLQGGVKKIRVKPAADEQVLKLEDLYFIIEPRFAAENFHLNFTLFNFPPESVTDELFYVLNPIGCNLAVYVDNLQLGTALLTSGVHATFSAGNTTLSNISHVSPDELSLQLAPFVSARIFGGTCNIAVKLDVFKLASWYDSFKFTAGYKVLL